MTAQQQNRVPRGVPVGGQFAEGTHGEPELTYPEFDGSQDRPLPGPSHPLVLTSDYTRDAMMAGRARVDGVHKQIGDVEQQIDELPLADPSFHTLNERRRDLEAELSDASNDARTLMGRHAMTEAGMSEVLAEIHSESIDEDAKSRYGLTIHPTILENAAAHMTRGYEEASANGIGNNCRHIPAALARRRLPKDAKVSRVYLTGQSAGTKTTGLTVVGQSAYAQRVEDSSGRASYLGWTGNRVLEDDNGNLLICDGNDVPFVAYTPEDEQ